MAYRIHEIPDLAGRTVLFDANVLIYNFWPSGLNAWENNYSRAFKQLLSHDNPLAISFVVLSEVVNRVLRIEHTHYSNATGQTAKSLPFKRYRDSPEGQQTLSDIYDIVRGDILPHFTLVDQVLTLPDVDALLTVGPLDFNDAYIVKLCQDQNLVLLTNDKDFKECGIDLLSSNPNL